MDRNIYVGNANNVAKTPDKIYVGDENGIARLVSKIYVGNSNNKACQVWPPFNWDSVYQKCEYIMNYGLTQWINTGIAPNNYTRFVLDFQIDQSSYSATGDKWILGVRHPYNLNLEYSLVTNFADYKYKLYFDTRNNGRNGQYDAPVATKTYSSRSALIERHTIDFNRSGGYFYIDDELVGSSVRTFDTYTSNTLPIFGFRTNASEVEANSNITRYRLYSFKMYDNNTLTRDMIPCYRKSDTEIGLYDLVNDVFYTNQGTGIFYKGPDV